MYIDGDSCSDAGLLLHSSRRQVPLPVACFKVKCLKWQRAACHDREKLEWQQCLQRQEIQKMLPGNPLPSVRSRQYHDTNPFAPENNYKYHLYNPWEFIKCFHGCYLMDFIWAWGVWTDEEPPNPSTSAHRLVLSPCLLPKVEPWKPWPPLGTGILPPSNHDSESGGYGRFSIFSYMSQSFPNVLS